MTFKLQRSLRLLLGVATLLFVSLGLYHILATLAKGPDPDRFHLLVLFKDVRGLRIGSTVKYRGMQVGEVASLVFEHEEERVRVELRMKKELATLLRSTTQIWIVRPRFGGLAGELSGLDTLIKDSYLRIRSRDGGDELPAFGELLGLELPPKDLSEGELENPVIGDLLATVVLPEPHGLHPGSPVLHRGIEVGEVRRIAMAERGLAVLVHIRVRRSYRATLREGARFWVARPIFKGNLITGITASGLDTLLKPSLVYDAHELKDAVPAPDDAVFTGLAEPPEDVPEWTGKGVTAKPIPAEPRSHGLNSKRLSPHVEVRYRAIESDTFSDDQVSARGEGLLYRARDGQVHVLTARSICDGLFFLEERWYDSIDLRKESIRVLLADGRVLPARKAWWDSGDRDIMVLRLQLPDDAASFALPDWWEYMDFKADVSKAGAKPKGRKPPYLLKQGERVIGIHGKAKAGTGGKGGPIPLSILPKSLQPKQR